MDAGGPRAGGAASAGVREAARVLTRRAADVRDVRRGVTALAGLAWQSPAAVAFRERLDGHAREIEALAAGCDVAAGLLRAHAEAVDAVAAVPDVPGLLR